MGIMTDLGNLFGTDPGGPGRLIQNLMEGEYRSNVGDAIKYAEAWYPTLNNGSSFLEEMEARCAYLQGSMWGDMDAVLAARFPITYPKIKDHQVNVQLFKRITESKAKAFYGHGTRFYLEGDDGEELPAEDQNQERFQAMLETGRFLPAFKDADRYTQALTRSVVKLWWDPRTKCVQATVWPQHLVYWVPNPNLYWSPDDCPAVFFRLPGRNGLNAADQRYEVWAKVQEAGAWKTIHFRTGMEWIKEKRGNEEVPKANWYEEKINETDTFPFVDEETKEPVYPFELWKSDSLLLLYNAGAEDSLTIPRETNLMLTDLAWGTYYEQHPLAQWVPTRDDVTSQPPAQITVGPGEIVCGGDWKIEFAHPEFDAKQYQEVVTNLTDLSIQMEIGTSSGVLQEDGAGAESGISVAIKRQPLYEYRQDQIEIYRPHVLSTLRRAIMVHNTYSEEKIIGTPCWEPGDIVDVQDKEAEARMWVLKIEKNIATAADWLMNETGMDRQQAEEAIKKNVEENKKVREDSQVMPLVPPGMPRPFGQPAPKPGEKPEEKPKPAAKNGEEK